MATPFLATPPEVPSGPLTDPGERGVIRLGTLISRHANILDQLVHQMNRIVVNNGRAAIETELGANSAELALLYGDLKACAELLGSENLPTLPDLP